MYADIPSANSLHSIYCFLERPVIVSREKKHKKLIFIYINNVFSLLNC